MKAKKKPALIPRRCEPSVALSDPEFVYVPAADTDVRRVFIKTDPNWPFGVLDPRVVARRRWEAARNRQRERQQMPEALL